MPLKQKGESGVEIKHQNYDFKVKQTESLTCILICMAFGLTPNKQWYLKEGERGEIRNQVLKSNEYFLAGLII
jgi:hypothetical protein